MKPARLVALALLGASVLVAVPATAHADPAPGTTAVHIAAATDQARAEVIDHWTPDRMRNATPLDLLEVDPAELDTHVRTGAPRQVAPTALPEPGAPWDGGGDVTATAGRVFFSLDGQDASCSGNAVTSANGSTVLTAGHCVKYQGSWHTNWVFVPGYHDGEAPYGEWAATQTLTTPQWEAGEDMNYDVGIGVVGQVDGRTLTDVVGAQGVSFNGEYNLDMYSFGYPAADPYDGTTLIYCSATSGTDFLLTDDHMLACDMTGGSSGGPWFVDFDETTGTGQQASVNSFGYVFLPGYMFGPYFGDVVEDLYDTAQNA